MRRTYGRDPLYGLLLTFGVAMVLEEMIRQVWGTRDYMLPVPREMSGGFIMLDLIWSTYRFWAAALAVAAMAVVWVIVERTRFGAMVKAGAHDSEIVQALGIDLARLRVGVRARHHAGGRRRRHPGAAVGHPPAHGGRRGGAGLRHHRARRGGELLGAAVAGLLVGMVVGLSGAYASEWSMLSMYLLLILVVTLPRPRAVRQEERPGGLTCRRAAPCRP